MCQVGCELKNELTDVDQPSRWEYVALLSTPNLCVEEKLRGLQQQLDALNAEPVDHNELYNASDYGGKADKLSDAPS